MPPPAASASQPRHPFPLMRRISIAARDWLGGKSPDSDERAMNEYLMSRVPRFNKRINKKRRPAVYDVGGKKTITCWGAYIYLLNQFLDCLPSLPYIIITAGWLPTFLVNLSTCAIATFIALMIMRAMTMISGNQNFELRYEYVPTARHFLGHSAAVSLEVGFHVLQVLNFLAINSVARLLDLMLLKGIGFTAGLCLYPRQSLILVRQTLEELYRGGGSPDGDQLLTVSLGYALCGLVCIPLCHYNLDEGISAQWGILAIATLALVVVIVASMRFVAVATLAAANVTSAAAAGLAPLSVRIARLVLWRSAGASSDGLPLLGSRSAESSSGAQRNVKDVVIGALRRIAGSNLFPFLDLEEFVDSRDVVREVRTAPELQMCAPCTTDLCQAFARQHAQCPMLWDGLLQQIVMREWQASHRKDSPRPPSRWGRRQFQQTFAIFISGYSFTNTIPSWANELQSDVEIPKVLWRGTLSACAVFFVFGWLLAYAFPEINSEDALQEIVENYSVPSYFIYSVYSFELVTVALGVVVNCVASRYNLTNSGKCRSPQVAFFFACVCPFLFAWMFAGSLIHLKAFLGWAALILSLTCNFVAPAVVYIVACQTSPLAYRNPIRNKSVRLGIQFFKPKRGTVEEVQAALRQWALAMAKHDVELRALLESGYSSHQTDDGSHSRSESLVGGPDDLIVPSLESSYESQKEIVAKPSFSLTRSRPLHSPSVGTSSPTRPYLNPIVLAPALTLADIHHRSPEAQSQPIPIRMSSTLLSSDPLGRDMEPQESQEESLFLPTPILGRMRPLPLTESMEPWSRRLHHSSRLPSPQAVTSGVQPWGFMDNRSDEDFESPRHFKQARFSFSQSSSSSEYNAKVGGRSRSELSGAASIHDKKSLGKLRSVQSSTSLGAMLRRPSRSDPPCILPTWPRTPASLPTPKTSGSLPSPQTAKSDQPVAPTTQVSFLSELARRFTVPRIVASYHRRRTSEKVPSPTKVCSTQSPTVPSNIMNA